jgi:hypothetical protein
MANINFVPDDYVQSNESRRANLMCLILFSVVMAALGGSFFTIKVRQRSCNAQETLVNAKMARMQEAIDKFEALQTKRKEMMKTALTTAELLEPIPRSVLLASLTNSLPVGTSLVNLKLIQREPSKDSPRRSTPKTNYQAANAQGSGSSMSAEQMLDTHMTIEGVAPTDLQVAAYIERLGHSILIDNVALVESKEQKVDGSFYRHFKLTAMLNTEVHLTKEDIEEIRAEATHTMRSF